LHIERVDAMGFHLVKECFFYKSEKPKNILSNLAICLAIKKTAPNIFNSYEIPTCKIHKLLLLICVFNSLGFG